MTSLTEGEIERGMAALFPYVQEWGLALNPENIQAMAVAVMVHSRSDASPEAIEQAERDWIRKDRGAHDAMVAEMGRAAQERRGGVPLEGLTEDELTVIEGRAAVGEEQDFIAHAREDVSRLVAEVRRLRALLS